MINVCLYLHCSIKINILKEEKTVEFGTFIEVFFKITHVMLFELASSNTLGKGKVLCIDVKNEVTVLVRVDEPASQSCTECTKATEW